MTDYVNAAITEGLHLPIDPYADLFADLALLELKTSHFATELGLSVQTIYGWKTSKVPKYATAYVDKCLALKTATR